MTNAVLTAYCACVLCCGKWAGGPTASGAKPVAGVTIAGPRAVPLGSVVVVTIPGVFEGRRFIVQDRTAKKFDGRWDIFFSRHSDALRFGRKGGTVATVHNEAPTKSNRDGKAGRP